MFCIISYFTLSSASKSTNIILMNKLTLLCLIFVISFFQVPGLYSQSSDTLELKTCRVLVDLEKYDDALLCYKNYENNITACYFGAFIAQKTKNKKQFKYFSNKLISKELENNTSYMYYCNLYKTDSKRYIELLTKGIQKYPTDTALLVEITNYYLEKNDHQSALTPLLSLISLSKSSPNKSYFFAAGCVYDHLKDTKTSQKYYEMAIETDTFYFEAYFNLAVSIFNQAVYIFEKANTIPDNNKYYQVKLEGDRLLAESIPYFERARYLKPDDRATLEALKTVYYRLKMNDKHAEVQNDLTELGN